MLAVEWESIWDANGTPECSSMRPLSMWLGLLSVWGPDDKRERYIRAKAEVTGALKARTQKSWVTIPTAFCWSKQSQGWLPREGKQTWEE